MEAKWYCNSKKVAEVALGLLLNSSRIPHSLPSKETGKIHRNSNNNKDRVSGRIQGGKIPPQKKKEEEKPTVVAGEHKKMAFY